MNTNRNETIIAALDSLSAELSRLVDAGRLQADVWTDLDRAIRACESRCVATMTDAERERYNRLRTDGVLVLDALCTIEDERDAR